MTVPLDVATLISTDTPEAIFAIGLEIAVVQELPVTTWRTGDPTLSEYKFLSVVLAEQGETNAEYIRSGFLSTARGDWLKLRAYEEYGVVLDEASYATPTVEVENEGGGIFTFAPGGMTMKSSVTGKTYHNTNDVTVSGLGDLVTFEMVADESGSDSSVGVDEIDEIVTSADGLEIVSSTASAANDAPSETEIKTQCRASLGVLSPNGPADAFEFVARNTELTGVSGVTRAKSYGSVDGDVTVYIAGPDGAVDGATVSAVQDAELRWALPLCNTVTTVSAAVLALDLAVTVRRKSTLTATVATIQTTIENVLRAMFADVPIGGDSDNEISESSIQSEIHAAFPDQIESVSLDDFDSTLGAGQVPTLNSLALTVV